MEIVRTRIGLKLLVFIPYMLFLLFFHGLLIHLSIDLIIYIMTDLNWQHVSINSGVGNFIFTYGIWFFPGFIFAGLVRSLYVVIYRIYNDYPWKYIFHLDRDYNKETTE